MSDSTLSTRKLRYFIATARTGSFVAAARHLNMSQPALSLQIKELEDHLGVSLLLRSSRQLRLTEAGEEFLVHAEEAVTALNRAEASVARFRRNTVEQPVRLGLIPTIGKAIVHELLKSSRERGVVFDFKEGISSELLKLLVEGELDATFCYDPPSAGSKYRILPLVYEYPVVVARRELVDPNVSHITFDDLARLPLLLAGRNTAIRVMLENYAAERGIALNIRYELPAVSMHRAILLREDVYSFIPQGHFLPDIESGLLAKYAIEPPLKQTLSAVFSAGLNAEIVAKVTRIVQSAIDQQLQEGRQGWHALSAA